MPALFQPKKSEEEDEKKKSTGGALFKPNTPQAPAASRGGGALFKPNSVVVAPVEEDPYDTTSVERSIANAQMRIKDAGGEINPDKRNPLEKALNLPEGQNWLFDVFDVLGRPQQAVYGAVRSSYKGGDMGDAAWKGFSGQEKISGSDFIGDMGLNNKLAKAGLGFAVDVVADPINLVPGGAVVKVAKAGSKIASVPGKALNMAIDAIPAAKNFRDNKVVPLVDNVKDTLGEWFKYQHNWDKTLTGGKDDTVKDAFNEAQIFTRNKSEDALKGVANQARAAGGYNTGDDVGRIMESGLRQFEDVKGFEFPDGVRRTENKSDLLDAMSANRDAIKATGKEISETGRAFNKQISQTADELGKVEGQIRRYYFSRENAALRQLNQRKNKPLNLDELAQKKAFDQVGNSPKFNVLLKKREELKTRLDTLRREADQAKAANVGKIRSLTDENAKLKESSQNPVMIQKEFERPVRELSQDPRITSAANELMQKNAAVRQLAQDYGIHVGEIEGYLKHMLSKEERALRKNKRNIDRGNFGIGQPSGSFLKSRELMGSAEDVNERVGRKLFETNAFLATALGQKQLIEYVGAMRFRRAVLSNPSFAVKYQKGMEPPPGTVRINTANYKFLDDEAAKELGLADEIGGEYIVTKGVEQALKRLSYINTDEGIQKFLRGVDKVMSMWKRLALLSGSYHLRNLVGGLFNSYVAGMNTWHDIPKYGAIAIRELTEALRGKESALYKEFREQGLANSSQLAVDLARAGDAPEKAMERAVRDLSKSPTRRAAEKLNPLRVFDTSQESGTVIDQANRIALYAWAKSKGMSPKEAARKVREVQFDYTRTTNTEKEVFTRLAPFYRWTRNNLPFQIRQFIHDPKRYTRVNHLYNFAQNATGVDEENMPDYMKDNFYFPTSGDGQGGGSMLALNLPAGDLTKLSNPLKLGMDMMTPVIKTPMELATNRNFFFNNEIESFEGEQKKYQVPENIWGMNIPGGGKPLGGLPVQWAYALEQAGGQPVRGLSKMLSKPTVAEQENEALKPSLGISSLIKKYDVNKENYYQKKEELQKLMDYIDYLEQEQGQRPRSVSDIKRGLPKN